MSVHVISQNMLVFKNTRADFTLERHDITDAVNSTLMLFQIPFQGESFAANVTLTLRVRTLSSAGLLSMCRVVVSAEHWLVEKHHVTQLTHDTRRSCLKHRKEQVNRCSGICTIGRRNWHKTSFLTFTRKCINRHMYMYCTWYSSLHIVLLTANGLIV